MSGRRAQSLRPIGQIAAEVVADLRRRRKVQPFYRLGDRVLGEFLAELGAERGITTIIDQKMEKYINIDPAALEATGGDQFPAVPIHAVRS